MHECWLWVNILKWGGLESKDISGTLNTLLSYKLLDLLNVLCNMIGRVGEYDSLCSIRTEP